MVRPPLSRATSSVGSESFVPTAVSLRSRSAPTLAWPASVTAASISRVVCVAPVKYLAMPVPDTRGRTTVTRLGDRSLEWPGLRSAWLSMSLWERFP
jgi:hypothetical protein